MQIIVMTSPRLEINYKKIAHNLKTIIAIYETKSIAICAVTKVLCGDVNIARLLVQSGATMLADSKINNFKKMHEAKLQCQFLLLGPPKISEVNLIVKYADISLNTEVLVIRELSKSAVLQKVIHKVILMVECGDLREGIMPEDLEGTVAQVLKLKGVEVVGIGTNLMCLEGVQPTKDKMRLLSQKVVLIEKKFNIHFPIISGGNSANYNWLLSVPDPGRINHLRIGESIFLGRETIENKPIPELFLDAFTLVAEVVELKMKLSDPFGQIGEYFFRKPLGKNKLSPRAILSIGLQDVDVSGLYPEEQVTILNSSSDHLIINPMDSKLKLGCEVRFNLNYSALLAVMTSPNVLKVNISD